MFSGFAAKLTNMMLGQEIFLALHHHISTHFQQQFYKGKAYFIFLFIG